MTKRNLFASVKRPGPWAGAILGTKHVAVDLNTPVFDPYDALAEMLRSAQAEESKQSFAPASGEDEEFPFSNHENDYSDFGESGEFVDAVEFHKFYYEALKPQKESEIGEELGGEVGDLVTRSTLDPSVADQMTAKPTWQITISVVSTKSGVQNVVGSLSAKEAEAKGMRLRRAKVVSTQDPAVAQRAEEAAITEGAVRQIKLPAKTLKLEHAPAGRGASIKAEIDSINAQLPSGYRPLQVKKVRVRVHDKQRDTENRTLGSFEYRGKGGRRLVNTRLDKEGGLSGYHTARSLIDAETGKAISNRPMTVEANQYSTRAGEVTSILPAEWYFKNDPKGEMATKLKGAKLVGKVEIEQDPYMVLYETEDPAERNAILRRMGVLKSSELSPHTLSAVHILNEGGAHNGELSPDNILAYAVNKLSTSNGFLREEDRGGQRRLFIPREEGRDTDTIQRAATALEGGADPKETIRALPPGDIEYLKWLRTSNAVFDMMFGGKASNGPADAVAKYLKPDQAVLQQIKEVSEAAKSARQVFQIKGALTPEAYAAYVGSQKELVNELEIHSPRALRQFILSQPYVNQTADVKDPEGLHGSRVPAHEKTVFKDTGERGFIPNFTPNADSSVNVNWESRFGRVPADDRKLAALETGLRLSAGRSVAKYTNFLKNKRLFKEVPSADGNGSRLEIVATNPEDIKLAHKTVEFFSKYPYINAGLRGVDLRGIAARLGVKSSDPQVRMLAAVEGAKLSEQQDFNLMRKLLNPQMFSRREVPYGVDSDDPTQRGTLTIFVPLNEEAQDTLHTISLRPVNEAKVEEVAEATGEPDDDVRVALWADRTQMRKEIKRSKQEDELRKKQLRSEGRDPNVKPWAERLLGQERNTGLTIQERARAAKFGVDLDMQLQGLYADHGFAFSQSAPVFNMKGGGKAPDVITRTATPGEPILVNLQEYAKGENGKTPEMAHERYGVTITRDDVRQEFLYRLETRRLNSIERLPAVGDEPLKEYTSGLNETQLNQLGFTRVPPDQGKGLSPEQRAELGDQMMGDEDLVMQTYNELQQQPFYRRHRTIAYNTARRKVLEKKFADNKRAYGAMMRELSDKWKDPAFKEAIGEILLPIAKKSAYGMARTKMDARDYENVSRMAPNAMNLDRMQDYTLQAVGLMLRPEPEVMLSAHTFLPRAKDNPNKIDWSAVEKNPATADFARRMPNGDRVAEIYSAEDYLNKALEDKFPDPDQRKREIARMIDQKRLAYSYNSFFDLMTRYTYALPPETQGVDQAGGQYTKANPRLNAYKTLITDSMTREMSRIMPPETMAAMTAEQRQEAVLDAMGKKSVDELGEQERSVFQHAVDTGELPLGFPTLDPMRREQLALQMFGVSTPEALTGTQKMFLDGIRKGRMPMSITGRLTTEMNRAMSTARTMVQRGSGPLDAVSIEGHDDNERSNEEMIAGGDDPFSRINEEREELPEGMYVEDKVLREKDRAVILPAKSTNIFSALSGNALALQSRRQEAETLLALFTEKLRQFQQEIPRTESLIRKQVDALPRIQNQISEVDDRLARMPAGSPEAAEMRKKRKVLQVAYDNAVKNESRWQQESKLLQYSLDKAFTKEDPQNLLRRVGRLRAIGVEYDRALKTYEAQLSDLKMTEQEVAEYGVGQKSIKDLKQLRTFLLGNEDRQAAESAMSSTIEQLRRFANEFEQEKMRVYSAGAELLMLRRDSMTNMLQPGEAYTMLNDMVSQESMNQIDRLSTFANPSEVMPPPYRTVGNLPDAAGPAYAQFLDLVHRKMWRRAFDAKYWQEWRAKTGEEPKSIPGMLAQYLSQLGGMHIVSVSRMRDRTGTSSKSSNVTGDMAGMADYVKHWLKENGGGIPPDVKLQAMAMLEQSFLIPGTLLADSSLTGISDEQVANGEAPPEVAFAIYANSVMKGANVTQGDDLNKQWMRYIWKAQDEAGEPRSRTTSEAVAWYGNKVMAPGFAMQFPKYADYAKQIGVAFGANSPKAPKLNFDTREDYLGYARLTGTAMLTHALFVDEMVAHSQEKGIAQQDDESIGKFIALKALKEHERLRGEYEGAVDRGDDYKAIKPPVLETSVKEQVEAFFTAYPDFDDERKSNIMQVAQARAAQANKFDHPTDVAKTDKDYRERYNKLERDVDLILYRLRRGYPDETLEAMDKKSLATHIMKMEQGLQPDEVGKIAERVYWRLHHDVGGQLTGVTPVLSDQGRAVVYNPGTSGAVGLHSPNTGDEYAGETGRQRAIDLIRQPVDMRRRVYERVGDPTKVRREDFQEEIGQNLGEFGPKRYKKVFHPGMLSPIAPIMLPQAPAPATQVSDEVTKAFVIRQLARTAQILDKFGLLALADDVDRIIAASSGGVRHG